MIIHFCCCCCSPHTHTPSGWCNGRLDWNGRHLPDVGVGGFFQQLKYSRIYKRTANVLTSKQADKRERQRESTTWLIEYQTEILVFYFYTLIWLCYVNVVCCLDFLLFVIVLLLYLFCLLKCISLSLSLSLSLTLFDCLLLFLSLPLSVSVCLCLPLSVSVCLCLSNSV